MHSSEYPIEKLPKKVKQEGNPVVETAKAKVHAIVKKQMFNAINGKRSKLDQDLIDTLQQLYDCAYSKGLSDMDKMHLQVENLG